MNRAHNFSAGPAVLPVEVLQETAQAVLDYNNSGMSIMEISHRSKEYDAVFKETQANGLKIMGLSEADYTVLFLGGGASLQFIMVPMNFLKNKADYVNTGEWASKAIKEAKWVGETNVVASSQDKTFNYIPKDIKFNDARNNHSVITGNILDLQSDQLFNKITQTLGIEKVDLIISRMDGPLSFFDKNGAILDRIIRNWYNFLNKNGLMFIQFERTLESDTRFLVEKWSGVIKKRFPKVDIQTGNYVLRLHKGTDAPEELPPATQLFRE